MSKAQTRRDKRKGFTMALVVLVVIAYTLYQLIFSPYSWRQKLTIGIDTPAGTASGYSISQVNIYKVPEFLPVNAGRSYKLTSGEAVVIDLGGGKFLFGLLKGMLRIAERQLSSPQSDCYRSGSAVGFGPCVVNFEGTATVDRENYPLLVTFEDINDPASVKRVDPDDLDAAFGCASSSLDAPWRDAGLQWRDWQMMRAGGLTLEQYNKFKLNSYRPTTEQAKAMKLLNPVRDTSGDCYSLKSITLEITDEPITTGKVESVLGWHRGGQAISTDVWRNKLTSKQRSMLSSINWIKE